MYREWYGMMVWYYTIPYNYVHTSTPFGSSHTPNHPQLPHDDPTGSFIGLWITIKGPYIEVDSIGIPKHMFRCRWKSSEVKHHCGTYIMMYASKRIHFISFLITQRCDKSIGIQVACSVKKAKSVAIRFYGLLVEPSCDEQIR